MSVAAALGDSLEEEQLSLVRFRGQRGMLVMGIVVLMPLAGAAWALSNDAVALALAGLITFIALLVVVFEEAICTSVDQELEKLYKIVEEQRLELNSLRESVREEDRIVGGLAERNAVLAAELISRRADHEVA